MQTITKSKNIKNKKKWTLFMLLLFACLYIPSLYSWVQGEHIATDIIKHGTIEDFINVDAYLVRNEELIKAPFTGKCVLNYDEGTKVPAGANIITIYKENVDKTLQKIDELEKKVIDAQREKFQNDVIFLNDIRKIDDEIDRNVKQLADMSISGNIADSSKIRQQIDACVKKKATITGPLSTSDEYIQRLKKDLESCKTELNSKKQDILSQTTGVISYTIDSVEEYFNEDAIRRITSKDFEKLNVKTTIFKDGEVVDANKVFAKVVNNIEAYIVVIVNSKHNFDLNVDDFVKIRINELYDMKIEGEVNYISDEQDKGKKLVAIKINKGIDETVNMRKINVDLIRKETNGLKVCTSALTNIDQQKKEADIFVVNHNYAVKKKVKIVYSNSLLAIIDATDDKNSNSIGAYEEYIIDARNVREGMIVRK